MGWGARNGKSGCLELVDQGVREGVIAGVIYDMHAIKTRLQLPLAWKYIPHIDWFSTPGIHSICGVLVMVPLRNPFSAEPMLTEA
jgi:hypothetical protein